MSSSMARNRQCGPLTVSTFDDFDGDDDDDDDGDDENDDDNENDRVSSDVDVVENALPPIDEEEYSLKNKNGSFESPQTEEGDDEGDTTDGGSMSSQPLKTLKKLQAMLEETDYATSAGSGSGLQSSKGIIHDNQNDSSSSGKRSGSKVTDDTFMKSSPMIQQQQQRRPTQQKSMPANQQLSEQPQQLPQSTKSSMTDLSLYELPSASANEGMKTSTTEPQPPPPNRNGKDNISSPTTDVVEPLWTSKDRSKYKRQRKLQRVRELQKQRQAYVDVQEQPMQSDDDSHGTDDTDDGLGLPNLPVYFSDAESTDDKEYEEGAMNEKHAMHHPLPPTVRPTMEGLPIYSSSNGSQSQQQPQPQPQQFQPPIGTSFNPNLQQHDLNFQRRLPMQQGQSPPYQYHYLSQQYNGQSPMAGRPLPPSIIIQQQQQQQQQLPQGSYQYPIQGEGSTIPYNLPYPLPPQNPFSYMTGHHGHLEQIQQLHHPSHQQHNYPGWTTTSNQPPNGYSIPYPGHPYYPTHGLYPQPQTYIPSGASHFIPRTTLLTPPQKQSDMSMASGMRAIEQQSAQYISKNDKNPLTNPAVSSTVEPLTRSAMDREVGFKVSFDSIQKMVFYFIGTLLLCYCAVSPRTLPFAEYNQKFKKNIQRVMLMYLVPGVTFLLVFDSKETSANALVNTFYASATLGYSVALILEVIVTTLIRLGVFLIWEPAIFELTPQVPLIILPWTLREQSYRPKRITLFAADFAATCIASPIIEEYVKLKIVEFTTKLPSNYRWRKLPKHEAHGNKKKKRRRKQFLEEIVRQPGDAAVTNLNSYMSHMYAASVGIKLCETTRRILLYTKQGDAYKSFYAFFRGFYPIHELCGCMTALELAKRNILGMNLPLWRMIFPAVFIHGMANLKGKKPIFKWNSSSPWSEIQMSPWYMRDPSMTTSQMLSKGFTKLMWFVVMGRVLGYIIKNYYMIGRKAVKRTTTFAGKNASFSAELRMESLLKKKPSSTTDQQFNDGEPSIEK
eukprot:CAMPEP_0176501246 /NCGR_PEP_ID=MMETSP0200_2-20121128/14053_1 /TAXON_ID=947934 /ORGANISM="Chaetoceros sp., Strain GSL56" /LENGTH=1004 /DNA_ID=CAMNT_0017900109 /DNA_START=140 /DNA_END=3154 /DNA_ORIENTATION=+